MIDLKKANRETLVCLIRDFQKSRGVPTALAEAVRYSLGEEVERLIAEGAAVNSPNEHGTVPLAMATKSSIAAILVKHGADVNAPDRNGQTPLIRFLHMLARPSQAETYVRFLLDAGAKPDVVDKRGTSAYQLALDKYGPRVADLLAPPEGPD